MTSEYGNNNGGRAKTAAIHNPPKKIKTSYSLRKKAKPQVIRSSSIEGLRYKPAIVYKYKRDKTGRVRRYRIKPENMKGGEFYDIALFDADQVKVREQEYEAKTEPILKEIIKLKREKEKLPRTLKGQRAARLIDDKVRGLSNRAKRISKPQPYLFIPEYQHVKPTAYDRKEIQERIDTITQEIAPTHIIEESFTIDRDLKLVDNIYSWFPTKTWRDGFKLGDFTDCDLRPRITMWVDGARRTVYGSSYNTRVGTSIDRMVVALAGSILYSTIERKWVFSAKSKRKGRAAKKYSRIGGESAKSRKIIVTVAMTYSRLRLLG